MFMISPLYIVTVLQRMIPGIGMISFFTIHFLAAIRITGDITVGGMTLITTMGTEDTGTPVTILNITNYVIVKGDR